MKVIFETTFTSQIELLPRISILYSEPKGIAFEWLWFSLFIGTL
jgi:hypothetical protein